MVIFCNFFHRVSKSRKFSLSAFGLPVFSMIHSPGNVVMHLLLWSCLIGEEVSAGQLYSTILELMSKFAFFC